MITEEGWDFRKEKTKQNTTTTMCWVNIIDWPSHQILNGLLVEAKLTTLSAQCM